MNSARFSLLQDLLDSHSNMCLYSGMYFAAFFTKLPALCANWLPFGGPDCQLRVSLPGSILGPVLDGEDPKAVDEARKTSQMQSRDCSGWFVLIYEVPTGSAVHFVNETICINRNTDECL